MNSKPVSINDLNACRNILNVLDRRLVNDVLSNLILECNADSVHAADRLQHRCLLIEPVREVLAVLPERFTEQFLQLQWINKLAAWGVSDPGILLTPDASIFFAGEHLSILQGWQEGAILSAYHAIDLVVARDTP